MFGIWRCLLAMEVVAHHLLGAPVVGFYAVFSFFVLSGFLMTAIMHDTYGYSLAGFGNYLGNRALRLFPNYWFAVAVSLALIALLGAAAVAQYNPAMTLPSTPIDWAQNLSMIFANMLPKEVMPRLVPLAWALTVELCYYVLIGLGASRTRVTTFIWLVLSFVYVVVIRQLHPEGGGYLYDAILAGSLPFSVGSLAWHFRKPIIGMLNRLRFGDARLLIAARWGLYLGILLLEAQTGWRWLIIFGNWLNIIISAGIICALFSVQPSNRLRQVDRAVGDYSYPVYLLHLQMGLLAGVLLYGGRQYSGVWIFAVGLALTVLLGTICTRIIDPSLDRIRRGVRQRARERLDR